MYHWLSEQILILFSLFRPVARIWTVVLLLGTCLLYCARVAMPICAVSMAERFSWSKRESGMVLGSFFWGYCFTQVLGGYISDRSAHWIVVFVAHLVTRHMFEKELVGLWGECDIIWQGIVLSHSWVTLYPWCQPALHVHAKQCHGKSKQVIYCKITICKKVLCHFTNRISWE